MNENLKKESISKEEAVTRITVLRDEIAPMGGNDFEIPTFNLLLQRLQKGECSPEFALKEAQKIRGGKQDDFI